MMKIVLSELSMKVLQSHEFMLGLHIKALSCHCECLGMNAENCLAACNDAAPPYNDTQYYEVMQKWGLIDKDGKPAI